MHYSVSVFHTSPYGFSIADVSLNKTQTVLSENMVEIPFPSRREIVEDANFLSILD
jgi:hypothetical protein